MTLYRVYILIALTLITACSQMQPQLDAKVEEEKIKELLEKESNYFVSHQIDKVMEVYHDSPMTTVITNVPISPGEAIFLIGYEEIKSWYMANVRDAEMKSYAPPEKSDWAFMFNGQSVTCTFIDTYVHKIGKNSAYRLVNLQRIKEEWKVVHSVTTIDFKEAEYYLPAEKYPDHIRYLLEYWKKED